MYFRGRITLHLTGSTIRLLPPANFFGGVANLLTGGSWQKKEEMELHKLLSFAQATNRALMEIGVRDVARVAIGKELVYEDLEDRPDDWDAALQALQQRLQAGMEPDPHLDFDLVLKHDDGVLDYVVDLDFVREHAVGRHPVAIVVTAIPSDLRRKPGEDETAFRQRVALYFSDQSSFDGWVQYWQSHFEGFLNQIAGHFQTNLGIEDVRMDVRKVLPRHRDGGWLDTYTDFGYPLYGYDPIYDLAYISLLDSLWMQNALIARDFYYGDFGAPYVYVGDTGWGYDDFNRYDTAYAAPPMATGVPTGSEWGPAMAPASSDSGGGGWLSSIGDFSSDSGGGGTVGWSGGDSSSDSSSSNCGGSSSSCSSSSSSCSSSSSSCSSSSCSSSSCGGGGCGGGGCSSS